MGIAESSYKEKEDSLPELTWQKQASDQIYLEIVVWPIFPKLGRSRIDRLNLGKKQGGKGLDCGFEIKTRTNY